MKKLFRSLKKKLALFVVVSMFAGTVFTPFSVNDFRVFAEGVTETSETVSNLEEETQEIIEEESSEEVETSEEETSEEETSDEETSEDVAEDATPETPETLEESSDEEESSEESEETFDEETSEDVAEDATPETPETLEESSDEEEISEESVESSTEETEALEESSVTEVSEETDATPSEVEEVLDDEAIPSESINGIKEKTNVLFSSGNDYAYIKLVKIKNKEVEKKGSTKYLELTITNDDLDTTFKDFLLKNIPYFYEVNEHSCTYEYKYGLPGSVKVEKLADERYVNWDATVINSDALNEKLGDVIGQGDYIRLTIQPDKNVSLISVFGPWKTHGGVVVYDGYAYDIEDDGYLDFDNREECSENAFNNKNICEYIEEKFVSKIDPPLPSNKKVDPFKLNADYSGITYLTEDDTFGDQFDDCGLMRVFNAYYIFKTVVELKLDEEKSLSINVPSAKEVSINDGNKINADPEDNMGKTPEECIFEEEQFLPDGMKTNDENIDSSYFVGKLPCDVEEINEESNNGLFSLSGEDGYGMRSQMFQLAQSDKKFEVVYSDSPVVLAINGVNYVVDKSLSEYEGGPKAIDMYRFKSLTDSRLELYREAKQSIGEILGENCKKGKVKIIDANGEVHEGVSTLMDIYDYLYPDEVNKFTDTDKPGKKVQILFDDSAEVYATITGLRKNKGDSSLHINNKLISTTNSLSITGSDSGLTFREYLLKNFRFFNPCGGDGNNDLFFSELDACPLPDSVKLCDDTNRAIGENLIDETIKDVIQKDDQITLCWDSTASSHLVTFTYGNLASEHIISRGIIIYGAIGKKKIYKLNTDGTVDLSSGQAISDEFLTNMSIYEYLGSLIEDDDELKTIANGRSASPIFNASKGYSEIEEADTFNEDQFKKGTLGRNINVLNILYIFNNKVELDVGEGNNLQVDVPEMQQVVTDKGGIINTDPDGVSTTTAQHMITSNIPYLEDGVDANGDIDSSDLKQGIPNSIEPTALEGLSGTDTTGAISIRSTMKTIANYGKNSENGNSYKVNYSETPVVLNIDEKRNYVVDIPIETKDANAQDNGVDVYSFINGNKLGLKAENAVTIKDIIGDIGVDTVKVIDVNKNEYTNVPVTEKIYKYLYSTVQNFGDTQGNDGQKAQIFTMTDEPVGSDESLKVVFNFNGGDFVGDKTSEDYTYYDEKLYITRDFTKDGFKGIINFPAARRDGYLFVGWKGKTKNNADVYSHDLNIDVNTILNKGIMWETDYVAEWKSLNDLEQIRVRYYSTNENVPNYIDSAGNGDKLYYKTTPLATFKYYPGYDFVGSSLEEDGEIITQLSFSDVSHYGKAKKQSSSSEPVVYYIDLYTKWEESQTPYLNIPIVSGDDTIYCYGEIASGENFDDRGFEELWGNENNTRFYNPLTDAKDRKWYAVTLQIPVDLKGGRIEGLGEIDKFIVYCGYNDTRNRPEELPEFFEIKSPTRDGKSFAGFSFEEIGNSDNVSKELLQFKSCSSMDNFVDRYAINQNRTDKYHACAMYYDTEMAFKVSGNEYITQGVTGSYVTLPEIEGVTGYTVRKGVQDFSGTEYKNSVNDGEILNPGTKILSESLDGCSIEADTDENIEPDAIEAALKQNNILFDETSSDAYATITELKRGTSSLDVEVDDSKVKNLIISTEESNLTFREYLLKKLRFFNDCGSADNYVDLFFYTDTRCPIPGSVKLLNESKQEIGDNLLDKTIKEVINSGSKFRLNIRQDDSARVTTFTYASTNGTALARGRLIYGGKTYNILSTGYVDLDSVVDGDLTNAKIYNYLSDLCANDAVLSGIADGRPVGFIFNADKGYADITKTDVFNVNQFVDSSNNGNLKRLNALYAFNSVVNLDLGNNNTESVEVPEFNEMQGADFDPEDINEKPVQDIVLDNIDYLDNDADVNGDIDSSDLKQGIPNSIEPTALEGLSGTDTTGAISIRSTMKAIANYGKNNDNSNNYAISYSETPVVLNVDGNKNYVVDIPLETKQGVTGTENNGVDVYGFVNGSKLKLKDANAVTIKDIIGDVGVDKVTVIIDDDERIENVSVNDTIYKYAYPANNFADTQNEKHKVQLLTGADIPEGNNEVGAVFDFNGGKYIGDDTTVSADARYVKRNLLDAKERQGNLNKVFIDFNLLFPAVEKEGCVFVGWKYKGDSDSSVLFYSDKFSDARKDTVVARSFNKASQWIQSKNFNYVAVWKDINELTDVYIRYHSTNENVHGDKNPVNGSKVIITSLDQEIGLSKFSYYPGYKFEGNSLSKDELNNIEKVTIEDICKYGKYYYGGNNGVKCCVDIYSYWSEDTEHLKVPLVDADGNFIAYCYGEKADANTFKDIGIAQHWAGTGVEVYEPFAISTSPDPWVNVVARIPVDLGEGRIEELGDDVRYFVAYCPYKKNDSSYYAIKSPSVSDKTFAGFSLEVKDRNKLGCYEGVENPTTYKPKMVNIKNNVEFAKFIEEYDVLSREHEETSQTVDGHLQPYYYSAMYYDTVMDLEIAGNKYPINGVNDTYITLPDVTGVSGYKVTKNAVVAQSETDYLTSIDENTEYAPGTNILSNILDYCKLTGVVEDGTNVNSAAIETALKQNNIFFGEKQEELSSDVYATVIFRLNNMNKLGDAADETTFKITQDDKVLTFRDYLLKYGKFFNEYISGNPSMFYLNIPGRGLPASVKNSNSDVNAVNVIDQKIQDVITSGATEQTYYLTNDANAKVISFEPSHINADGKLVYNGYMYNILNTGMIDTENKKQITDANFNNKKIYDYIRELYENSDNNILVNRCVGPVFDFSTLGNFKTLNKDATFGTLNYVQESSIKVMNIVSLTSAIVNFDLGDGHDLTVSVPDGNGVGGVDPDPEKIRDKTVQEIVFGDTNYLADGVNANGDIDSSDLKQGIPNGIAPTVLEGLSGTDTTDEINVRSTMGDIADYSDENGYGYDINYSETPVVLNVDGNKNYVVDIPLEKKQANAQNNGVDVYSFVNGSKLKLKDANAVTIKDVIGNVGVDKVEVIDITGTENFDISVNNNIYSFIYDIVQGQSGTENAGKLVKILTVQNKTEPSTEGQTGGQTESPTEGQDEPTQAAPTEGQNDQTQAAPTEGQNDQTQAAPTEGQNEPTQVAPAESQTETTVAPTEKSSSKNSPSNGGGSTGGSTGGSVVPAANAQAQTQSTTPQGQQAEMKANASMSKLSNENKQAVQAGVKENIEKAMTDMVSKQETALSTEMKEVATNVAMDISAKMVTDMATNLGITETGMNKETATKITAAAADAAVGVAKVVAAMKAAGQSVDQGVMSIATKALAKVGYELLAVDSNSMFGLSNFASTEIQTLLPAQQFANSMEVAKKKMALEDTNVIKAILMKAEDYTGPSDNNALLSSLGVTNDKFKLRQDVFGRTQVVDTNGNVIKGFNKFNVNGSDKNYFLDDDGTITTGWVKDAADSIYFFTPDGSALVSQANIDNKLYTFNNTGKLVTEGVAEASLNSLVDLSKSLVNYARNLANRNNINAQTQTQVQAQTQQMKILQQLQAKQQVAQQTQVTQQVPIQAMQQTQTTTQTAQNGQLTGLFELYPNMAQYY